MIRYERFTIPDITGQNGTRERLMMAGENLMGRRGFSNVSLEEIASHAKQRNKYAVQYHFNNRDGLAQAILNVRMQQVELRRKVLLRDVDPADIHSILTAFLYPLAEQTDGDGNCSFARFLLQFIVRDDPIDEIVHPVLASQTDSPTLQLFEMSRRAIGISDRELFKRTKLFLPVSLRFLAVQTHEDTQPVIPAGFPQVVRMIAAALAVQCPDELEEGHRETQDWIPFVKTPAADM
ncbi:hypothetical protein MB02_02940 [Croceicoccus estronivorus]|uniref:TetR/AcrR family transcriptional regulator n=1 Tax=Croceicoccus estronivorus TaxID=1172626 RepID=UPI00082AA9EA|nr:TetR/AcrR family transcriptional regulator [Croceicoccus estronivorus]OCC25601.1 hypothetical protein MB02_02940 [Croceicoccus estronivorus]